MRKIIALLMCFTFLTALAACKRSEHSIDEAAETMIRSDTVSPEKLRGTEGYALNAFDRSLIEYLNTNGYYDSDFVVSPAAFRASLCLAASGAEGNTRTELVNAAGFHGMDDFTMWYEHLQNAMTGSGETDKSCSMAASVWNDTDQLGEFTNSYVTQIQRQYHADAFVYISDMLTEKVNDWVSRETAGKIYSIEKDVSGASSVLVSAMYMQPLWMDAYTDSNGNTMERTGKFLYAEESGTKILVLPMQGNFSFVCFSGNRIDMFDKLETIQEETVHVVLPEFEMHSVFDANDLLNFLLTRGVSDALNGQTANFYNMCQDADWFLQEMVQASRISVYAPDAETNVSSGSETAAGHGQEIKEFVVDGVFSFAVCSDLGTSDQQVLLYGQRMMDGNLQ